MQLMSCILSSWLSHWLDRINDTLSLYSRIQVFVLVLHVRCSTEFQDLEGYLTWFAITKVKGLNYT